MFGAALSDRKIATWQGRLLFLIIGVVMLLVGLKFFLFDQQNQTRSTKAAGSGEAHAGALSNLLLVGRVFSLPITDCYHAAT
jgi:hypothetical protein